MSDGTDPPAFRRPVLAELIRRLREATHRIQVLSGPRQSGKTTLAQQAIRELGVPTHYASADGSRVPGPSWIEVQWNTARELAAAKGAGGALLVLDEIQKVPSWSGTVKALWDEDARNGIRVKAMILGSAPLLVQRGLGESLAGRFEILRVPHWSFAEMAGAFGWDLDRYLLFGGYPGAASLVDEPERWRAYILDSLVETTLSRDVLLLSRIDKPALLRQLFHLVCEYSGQILSFQKMLGQLQDVGNTTTLSHYLSLLDGAGLVAGLQKFSKRRVRQRGSIPKLLVRNTALMTAVSGICPDAARQDRAFWGRLVESSVGAHLLNTLPRGGQELFYWRERSAEVDFVLFDGRTTVAIEVKSGSRSGPTEGLERFRGAFHPHRQFLVGGSGVPLEPALRIPGRDWYHLPAPSPRSFDRPASGRR